MRCQLGISITVAFALGGSVGSADGIACEGIPITVQAQDRTLAVQTCRAASRILPRVAECGVVLSQAQTIEVKGAVTDLPDCMGLYHCGTNRIEIHTPDAIDSLRRNDGPFAALPTSVFFESILAHELAHAAYDAVPCPYDDCLVTSEYVAYAMQIYALQPTDQRLFAPDTAEQEKVSRYAFSEVSLFMAPDAFARNVWVHFSQREDGCAYVADMMRGDFYLDTERP